MADKNAAAMRYLALGSAVSVIGLPYALVWSSPINAWVKLVAHFVIAAWLVMLGWGTWGTEK